MPEVANLYTHFQDESARLLSVSRNHRLVICVIVCLGPDG
jgi:hypothetical protein